MFKHTVKISSGYDHADSAADYDRYIVYVIIDDRHVGEECEHVSHPSSVTQAIMLHVASRAFTQAAKDSEIYVGDFIDIKVEDEWLKAVVQDGLYKVHSIGQSVDLVQLLL